MSLIDTSFQAIQVILNKNSIGVLSPERFNVLARQVITGIFRDLTNEYRLASNKRSVNREGLDLKDIEHKLARYLTVHTPSAPSSNISTFELPSDFALAAARPMIYDSVEISEIPLSQNTYFTSTSIVSPSIDYPQFKRVGNSIKLYPDLDPEKIELYYFRNPLIPKWTYNVIDGVALFNASASDYVDLDIDDRLLNDFVMAVLELAGVHIRDQIAIQVSEAIKNAEFTKNNS